MKSEVESAIRRVEVNHWPDEDERIAIDGLRSEIARLHASIEVLDSLPQNEELSRLRAENARLRMRINMVIGAVSNIQEVAPFWVQYITDLCEGALAETLLDELTREAQERGEYEIERENPGGSSGREEPNRSERALLDDAMGLLHNHEQSDDADWREDLDDVCKRYDALLAELDKERSDET